MLEGWPVDPRAFGVDAVGDIVVEPEASRLHYAALTVEMATLLFYRNILTLLRMH